MGTVRMLCLCCLMGRSPPPPARQAGFAAPLQPAIHRGFSRGLVVPCRAGGQIWSCPAVRSHGGAVRAFPAQGAEEAGVALGGDGL